MKWGLIVIILLSIVVVGCNSDASTDPSPSPVSDQSDSSDSSSGYLAPDAYPEPDPGYPAPPTEFALPTEILPVPEPASSDSGTVTGILILDAESEEQPVAGAILYLGSIVRLSDGSPALAALDKQVAPSTQTTMVGQFIFEDIPAGEYTLILDQVTSSFVLNSPEGGDLLIQVQGGEIVDLGELRYTDLPLPQ